jgi:hypothetical protein
MSGMRIDGGRHVNGFPQCYIRVCDVWEEILMVRRTGSALNAANREIFEKDRQCPKWHRYTPGFSPQEHLEDVRMTELELKRQEFELRLFEMNRRLNEQSERSNKRVTCVLILFAIFEVLFGAASVLQLAYPEGWPWLMNLLGSTPSSLRFPEM